MSEKWALILTGAAYMAIMVVTMVAIKLLGGSRELMVCVGPLFVCAAAWQIAGVVMRYGDSDSRR